MSFHKVKKSLAIFVVMASSSCAFADGLAWVADGSANFGTLNLSSGAFTQTSSFAFVPAGLGEVGTTLYTADEGGTTLYSVDTTTGNTTALGTSSISYYAFGSTNSGLYMVDTVGGLWSINRTTGASNFVGSTLINIGSNSLAVSTGSDTLYVAVGNNVYTINTSTGQATPIGATQTTDFGALASVNGALYGTSIINANAVYTFSQTSGAETFVANATMPNYAYGLAPVVPEPGSVALLGLGLGTVGLLVWRKQRTV